MTRPALPSPRLGTGPGTPVPSWNSGRPESPKQTPAVTFRNRSAEASRAGIAVTSESCGAARDERMNARWHWLQYFRCEGPLPARVAR